MPRMKLPESSLERIKEGIQSTRDLDVLLNQAELTGRPVKEMREANLKNRTQLLKDKQIFFPNAG